MTRLNLTPEEVQLIKKRREIEAVRNHGFNQGLDAALTAILNAEHGGEDFAAVLAGLKRPVAP